jgi:thioredoxin-related protein
MHRSFASFKMTFIKSIEVGIFLAGTAFAQTADSVTPLPRPSQLKPIYSATANAKTEIASALNKAKTENKRVILVFGGNWCFDCHILDAAFKDAQIAPIVNANYEIVHVDIGQYDHNLDLAKQYNVNIKGGVPALAVLDPAGKVLFSDKGGEFESARSMSRADVVSFLNKWKPAKKG